MCFAPQRRAVFGHLNFQKCAKTVSFLAFWLGNVLRATAACNFSWLLGAGTSAPAALASLLFDPAGTQIIEKTQRFVTFLTFRAGVSSFYWLSRNCSFVLLTLLVAFASLPCVSTLHIVGSFTSKLPLIMEYATLLSRQYHSPIWESRIPINQLV